MLNSLVLSYYVFLLFKPWLVFTFVMQNITSWNHSSQHKVRQQTFSNFHIVANNTLHDDVSKLRVWWHLNNTKQWYLLVHLEKNLMPCSIPCHLLISIHETTCDLLSIVSLLEVWNDAKNKCDNQALFIIFQLASFLALLMSSGRPCSGYCYGVENVLTKMTFCCYCRGWMWWCCKI